MLTKTYARTVASSSSQHSVTNGVTFPPSRLSSYLQILFQISSNRWAKPLYPICNFQTTFSDSVWWLRCLTSRFANENPHVYASCVNLAIKLIGRRPLCMWLVANGDRKSGLMSSHKTRSVDVSKWIGYPVPSSRCTQIVAMNARSLASVLLEISPENKLVQIAKLGSCHQRNLYPWSLKIFKLYEGNSRMLGQGKHKALFFFKKRKPTKEIRMGNIELMRV